MSKPLKSFQECCLYFTTNTLSRYIGKLADDAFKATGLAPSYAHLMLLIIDEPGLSQNELSKRINVKASTMTRFIDKLMLMQFVERTQEGRNTFIIATQKGKELKPDLDKALGELYDAYCDVLGKEFAVKLTTDMHLANTKLNNLE
ncbi:MarR family transcriptional regulator [Psychroserpens sp. S379A]|uniref:MarR family transcriptional regulator n=1 Tax=Psychroserpens sp. S379A TaxID=3415137 RepID=UPI003C7DE3EB